MTLAASSSAPFWIAGWILVLAFVITVGTYFSRKRRTRERSRR